MTDKLAFLDEPQGSKETPAPISEPVATETASPAAPQTAPTETPIVEAKPAEPPLDWQIAKALDEREKRQAIERERDELKRKVEELSKQPEQKLDPLLNTDEWVQQQEAQAAKREQDSLFRITRHFAVRDHSEDAVKAAELWLSEKLKEEPSYFQTVMRQPDPYDFVVKQHKRSLQLAKIGDDDPETWAEKWAREKGYAIPERGADGKFVAAAPAPATATPLPKPSLASAPSASGNAPKQPIGPGVAFDSVFSK